MTREQMANVLDELVLDDTDMTSKDLSEEYATVKAAASVLRQSCAGCRHVYVWSMDQSVASCQVHAVDVPRDGSGYCWKWAAK